MKAVLERDAGVRASTVFQQILFLNLALLFMKLKVGAGQNNMLPAFLLVN